MLGDDPAEAIGLKEEVSIVLYHNFVLHIGDIVATDESVWRVVEYDESGGECGNTCSAPGRCLVGWSSLEGSSVVTKK